jgi:hypothetical protein
MASVRIKTPKGVYVIDFDPETKRHTASVLQPINIAEIATIIQENEVQVFAKLFVDDVAIRGLKTVAEELGILYQSCASIRHVIIHTDWNPRGVRMRMLRDKYGVKFGNKLRKPKTEVI